MEEYRDNILNYYDENANTINNLNDNPNISVTNSVKNNQNNGSGNAVKTKLFQSYNDIYLKFMEKLAQHCSFLIIDDHSWFKNNNGNSGRLMLIDPYDYETLQIFFDTELDKFPDKVDIIDVATGKKLDNSKCLNKFLVNVDIKKSHYTG